MSEQITMRIWTCMGKEHIYPVDYFRTHSDKLEIGSKDLNSILHTIEAGKPCNISFLIYSSESQLGRYKEHKYLDCNVVKGFIRYMAICVPA